MKAQPKPKRERAQLVISLGERPEGEELRGCFDRAAKAAGLPVTVWARRVLTEAAGVESGEPPTRRDFEALRGRAELVLVRGRAHYPQPPASFLPQSRK